MHQEPGQREAHHDLDQHLQHLAHGGGHHVAEALAVAAIGRHQAYQQHRGAHHADAQRGVRVSQDAVGDLVREQGHDQRADEAQPEEGPPGDREGAPQLIGAALGVGLGDHAGQCDGKARRRERQKYVIDVVGRVEERVSVVDEDIPDGHLVQEAQDLHDDHARGEDRRAVQIVLALTLRHVCLRME